MTEGDPQCKGVDDFSSLPKRITDEKGALGLAGKKLSCFTTHSWPPV